MEFVHVVNRGVEKRNVFLEEGDYIRFIHDMYVFNDVRSAPNYAVKERSSERKRDLLVRIHSFCLMPNHYHMLLSEAVDGGISFFMRKLNMGYAKYFNEKYERSGVLWQGVFRRSPVSRDAHFLFVPFYIHLNPLDLSFPEWRSGKVRDPKKALKALRSYRWSSHLDYLGENNFPSLLYKSDLQRLFGNNVRYEKEIENIIHDPTLATQSSTIEL